MFRVTPRGLVPFSDLDWELLNEYKMGAFLDACAEALAKDEDADLNADEFSLRGRLRNKHALRPPLHGWGELLREAWHLRHKDIVV
jgi:hypothetical protein